MMLWLEQTSERILQRSDDCAGFSFSVDGYFLSGWLFSQWMTIFSVDGYFLRG